jgi:diguanylate cyclase (GGDEF)-like protein
MGWEEFLILAPNSDLKAALTLANNIKELIEKTNFDIKDCVTVSISISTFNENLNQENLLKLADDALYKAKEKGRNTVETY